MNCINFVNFLAVYTSDLVCFHQFLFKFNKLTFFSRQINEWNINFCILLSSYLALLKVRRGVLIKINWNYLWLNSWCYSIQQSDLYRFGNEDCACLYWEKQIMMNVLLYFILVPNSSPCYVNFVIKPKGNKMKWFFILKR